MQIADDRTGTQKRTHPVLIIGRDSFMSGWGKATGGLSYAAWACREDDRYTVERWVRKRGDLKNIRVVGSDYKPQGVGHFHIYVVENGHPALN